MRIKIPITDHEEKFCIVWAHARCAKEKKFGHVELRKGQRSFDAHYTGVLGEFAVAKHFHVPIDTSIYDDHGDDGTDLVLPDFGPISVKATRYFKKPYLRIPIDEPLRDFYFLVCVDIHAPRLELVGYMPRETLQHLEVARLVPHGPMNYIAKEHHLQPLSA